MDCAVTAVGRAGETHVGARGDAVVIAECEDRAADDVAGCVLRD